MPPLTGWRPIAQADERDNNNATSDISKMVQTESPTARLSPRAMASKSPQQQVTEFVDTVKKVRDSLA